MNYLLVGGPEYEIPEGRYCIKTEDDMDGRTLAALIGAFRPIAIKRIA